MTVEELTELLKKYLPTLRVVVNGYEDGFDNVVMCRPDGSLLSRCTIEPRHERLAGTAPETGDADRESTLWRRYRGRSGVSSGVQL